MAEAMTVETILEADWQMRGFWTRLRFPLRTSKGGWSDIDLLAYDPEGQHLVLGESKVRGPKRDVYAFTAYTQATYGDLIEFDDNNYFTFLRHVGLVCSDGAVFKHFRKMVQTLTIQLVSNYYIAPDVQTDAERAVRAKIRKQLPKDIALTVQLETTLDVILRILTAENDEPQGRRYGHPIIDLARELNRYMRPNVKYAGRGAGQSDQVKAALAGKIAQAFRQRLRSGTLPTNPPSVHRAPDEAHQRPGGTDA